ncbi:MAG: hypothetical protein ACFCVK_01055 [Acidimicrobiales bacterium]
MVRPIQVALTLVVALGALPALAACSGDDPGPAGTGAAGTDAPAADPVGEAVLVTPCFSTGPELVLPDEWLATDVSPDDDQCLFVIQQDQLADTTVIAGELFVSSGGRSFDDFVVQVEDELAVGQEPDILALQLLNSGASGRDLPILERIDVEEPNRAVVFVHESDRRDGFVALSAVIDVPTEFGPAVTHAIVVWAVLAPAAVGEPSDAVGYGLSLDLIDSMRIVPQ